MAGKKLEIKIDPEVKAAAQEAIKEQLQSTGAMDELSEAFAEGPLGDETLSWELPIRGEIPTLTPDVIQRAAIGAALNQSEVKDGRSIDGMLSGMGNSKFSELKSDLKNALSHKEDIPTGAAAIKKGDSIHIVPASTRDKANSLYYGKNPVDGRPFRQKERAEMIFNGLFKAAAERVRLAAGHCGFNEKPLVWVSQIVYHQTQVDYDVQVGKFRQSHPELSEDLDDGFDVQVDKDPQSIIVKALAAFLDNKSVRELQRAAEYHNCSVLEVLRSLVWQYCDTLKIPVPQKAKVEE